MPAVKSGASHKDTHTRHPFLPGPRVSTTLACVTPIALELHWALQPRTPRCWAAAYITRCTTLSDSASSIPHSTDHGYMHAQIMLSSWTLLAMPGAAAAACLAHCDPGQRVCHVVARGPQQQQKSLSWYASTSSISHRSNSCQLPAIADHHVLTHTGHVPHQRSADQLPAQTCHRIETLQGGGGG